MPSRHKSRSMESRLLDRTGQALSLESREGEGMACGKTKMCGNVLSNLTHIFNSIKPL